MLHHGKNHCSTEPCRSAPLHVGCPFFRWKAWLPLHAMDSMALQFWLGLVFPDVAWCFMVSLLRLPNIWMTWMTWVQDNMPASLWGPTEQCRKIVIGTNNCGYSNECGCEAKICPKLPCYMLSCSCLPYSIQWSQNHIKPYNTFIFGMLWTTTNTNLRLQLWQLWVSMDPPEPLPGLPSRLGCLPKSEYRPQKTASKARLKWWKLIRPEMHGL